MEWEACGCTGLVVAQFDRRWLVCAAAGVATLIILILVNDICIIYVINVICVTVISSI